MNPFLVWLEENFVLVLSVAFALSTLCFVLGVLGAWRLGPRLRQPPRPFVRFGLSLVLVVAGAGGVLLFFDGLKTVVPAARAQQGMLNVLAPPLDFTYVSEVGEGSLANFRGQVVLLNVWATWCPPCLAEMPELDKLQTTHSAEGLVVLQISDESRETVSGYLDKHLMTTIHATAQPIPWPEFGRPTTFVIDRQGIVRKIISGQRDYEGFEHLIRAYL